VTKDYAYWDAVEKDALRRLAIVDPVEFAKQRLIIRDKAGKEIPFVPNRMQLAHYASKREAVKVGKPRRFLILKARRMGFTTWEQGESFHLVTNQPGQNAVTLAHTALSTEKIFKIATLFYNRMKDPPEKGPGFKREMSFPGLNSVFYIGTAGSGGFGRGDTLQRVHGSEVAFWHGTPDDIDNLIAGLTEAASHGEVVLESTANGMGNWFHNAWQGAVSGENEWTPLFYPWFQDPTNVLPFEEDEEFVYTEEEEQVADAYSLTPEQMKWRREKKRARGKLFPQEYPDDPATAFLSTGSLFFDPEIIKALLRVCAPPLGLQDVPPKLRDNLTLWRYPEKNQDYVIGADVSEGVGGNYSCACVLDKKGRQCATIRNNWWRPEEFARRTATLGELYNIALLAPEANNHGHSMLNSLKNTHHYPRLYIHTDYDKRLGSTKKLGWQTTPKTRPILLDDLAEAVHHEYMQTNDRVFLGECLTFADDGTGKYKAREGCYDDAVLAWGIAWQVRGMADLKPGSNTVQGALQQVREKAGYTECAWCHKLGYEEKIDACHLCACKPDGTKVTIIKHDHPSWRKIR
jgi:hypothetical protein